MKLTPEQEAEIQRFNAERNEALLTMDEARIRAFVRKWNRTDLPADPHIFWGAIHKAITGNGQLPLDFRRKSKEWLTQNGYQSHDDGEL